MAEMVFSVYGGMFDSTEVVETVDGFPRGNKAVDSSFFAKMISSFYADGILNGGGYGANGFRVLPSPASSGPSVTVSPGIAWVRGYMAWLQEAQSIELSAGHSYLIILRLNSAAGEFTLVAAEDRTTPPTDSEFIRELVIAELDVPAGCAAITEEMLTDTRADSGKCGYVTCSIDALNNIQYAANAGMLGGISADCYLQKSGGTMTGALKAAPEVTGAAAVRNISYGSVVPTNLADGEIFIKIV